MKKLLILVPLVIAAVGCGSSEAPKDDSSLRAELNKKELDYSNTPPDQRERVLGLMRANGGAAKADELAKKWGMAK